VRKLLRRFLQAAPPSQIAKRKLNLETLESRDVPNATAHSLAGSNFSQDWSNTGLITTNNDWSNVPSIIGYRGEGLTSSIGADPQTLTADISSSVYVLANKTNANLTTGGVGEFQLSNPVIALQGSGTADAPNIVLNLDSTGRRNLAVSYVLRDIDASVNNATSPVALQYRIGSSGIWTNVAAGFVADASQGPYTSGLEMNVSVVLPSAADNQSLVQVRIITTNNPSYDEWIGIDDISVTSGSSAPPIAVNDNYSTIHNQALTISGSGLLGNDTATGGATTLTATPQTNVATAHGFVTVQSNGGFTYTPNAGYVGADSFGYQVTDNFGNSSKATANINVTNANPTAQNFEFTTNRATPVTANLLTGSADADGDPRTVSIGYGPFHGTTELNSSTGAFTYTPASDWVGIETIPFTVSDGFGGTISQSVQIEVQDLSRIGGNVWIDIDENGSINSTEEPIGNMFVYLYQDGVLIRETMTDNLGNYNFHELIAGTYDIFVAIPDVDAKIATFDGWHRGITVIPGQQLTNINQGGKPLNVKADTEIKNGINWATIDLSKPTDATFGGVKGKTYKVELNNTNKDKIEVFMALPAEMQAAGYKGNDVDISTNCFGYVYQTTGIRIKGMDYNFAIVDPVSVTKLLDVGFGELTLDQAKAKTAIDNSKKVLVIYFSANNLAVHTSVMTSIMLKNDGSYDDDNSKTDSKAGWDKLQQNKKVVAEVMASYNAAQNDNNQKISFPAFFIVK